MGSMSAVSCSPLLSSRVQSPSASLGLLGGFRRTTLTININSRKSSLLHCSFTPSSSSLSFASSSSLSGLSLGVELKPNMGLWSGKRRGFKVVAAGRALLCLTKRNRSRKSLARTHGFRRRMRTTTGRAVLKRRRAKGRKVLCTKSYPRTGKGS